jgi:hypothetical protein
MLGVNAVRESIRWILGFRPARPAEAGPAMDVTIAGTVGGPTLSAPWLKRARRAEM